MVAQQKYESIKMKDGETMTEFDERFSAVVIELTSLGKEYSNRELALKVMRALPREWDVKTMAMRESKDLNKLKLHDFFANLKAYEFELETRAEAAPSTSQPTKALAATSTEHCSPSTSNTADQLSDDVMSLFVKKFGKYLRRSYNPYAPYNNVHINDKIVSDMNCFNCGRPRHFAADCNRSKKDDRYRRDEKKEDLYKRDDKTDERTIDRSKDRSKDRRMRTRGDKRPNRNNDRKVLVVEESTKSWADTDTDSSSSTSSSSDSEQEEVHCCMANQTSDDEVFDFSNVEFTREDLVSALNDMVKEYRKLSHSFEEIKDENENLKYSSIESSTDTLEDIESFKIELSKLMMENDLLRNESSELKAEIEKSNLTMSSWAKSSASLDKLFGIQKPASHRIGLGFNSSDSSEGEKITQSQLVYDKFNKMSFVKANVIHDPYESMKYNDQTPQKLNHKVKAGIGFQKSEKSKPSWLKNKLDKYKSKAGRKSFVPNQPWRSSMKVKSGWKRVQPKRDLNGQNMKSKLKRSHNYAQTLTDSSTGKTVKVIQVWVPKGVIRSGPK
ncbi:hypothetical protein F511_13432 [Dorcoceras hygrometricum]|uniref:CCHC-type domain-containing protein n=1 Tax=Dorcoceras hygrometricum TaxID=472368 RepID=A0A2Z7DGZ5_9LAMI|nr:hypothetical protein F511_13432 [Dorcoceras hygrometricum]